jgi:hypothetical protein
MGRVGYRLLAVMLLLGTCSLALYPMFVESLEDPASWLEALWLLLIVLLPFLSFALLVLLAWRLVGRVRPSVREVRRHRLRFYFLGPFACLLTVWEITESLGSPPGLRTRGTSTSTTSERCGG